jgi:molecular chaperone GrpE (heat shock protein)
MIRVIPRTVRLLRKYSTQETPKIHLKPDELNLKPDPEQPNTLNEQLKDLQDLYRRSLAESQNIRQRAKKEVEDAKVVITKN